MRKIMKCRRWSILLLTIFLMSGCSDESKTPLEGTQNAKSNADEIKTSRDVFAMDTYMTITAYGENGEVAVSKAVDEINRLDALLSTGDENSEIYAINRDKEGNLSDDTEYLFSRSVELYESTGGLFDIAIYPIMEEWGFTSQDYHVPNQNEIDELLKNIDITKINFDKDLKRISLEENMAVDFGGIAKGYTSGRIMDIFRECGVESGLVSLGGNVQLFGTKPDGTEWKVGIQSPDNSEEYIGILSTSDVAVITSGGYERCFEENGKKYHHIIDPRTGYPAESGLKSVTIVSSDGTLADGLSTSLYIMGESDSIEYWKNHSDEFGMILMRDDGTLIVSEDISDKFESDMEMQIISVN